MRKEPNDQFGLKALYKENGLEKFRHCRYQSNASKNKQIRKFGDQEKGPENIILC